MCDTCGCGLSQEPAHHHAEEHPHDPDPRRLRVELVRDLLAANDQEALENREHLLDRKILGVNLMSSPGAGKTSLIEAVVRLLDGRLRVGVIEGDLATTRDAERIAALNIPVWQIQTGSTCHLDAIMVHKALHQLPLERIDLLFVENVGNLVCPGLYDLGCHLNGVLLSTPEGDDKVAKYPVAFKNAQFFGISKVDLLPYLRFDPARPKREARILKGGLEIFELSAQTQAGIDRFVHYLEEHRRSLLA